MEALIGSIGRTAQQRTTLYQPIGNAHDSKTDGWNEPEVASRVNSATI